MFDEFMPEGIEEFQDMYMVQNYQMICSRLNKKGIKLRQYQHSESRAS